MYISFILWYNKNYRFVIINTKKCDYNEQYLISKDQLKNGKQNQSKHRPLQKLEVTSIEKKTSSADRSHPSRDLFIIGKEGKSVKCLVNNNGLTIRIKRPPAFDL